MSGQDAHRHGGDQVGTQVVDPVCGMTVDRATAKHVSVYDGRTFHFCGAGCKVKFDAAPTPYLSAHGTPDAVADCCAIKAVASDPGDPKQAHQHTDRDDVAGSKDPVCGMTVDPVTAEYHAA